MNRTARLAPLYAALILLFLLHNDLWLRDDGRIVFGLPAGLTYHVLYCLAASVLMALVVRWARPGSTDPRSDGDGSP